MKRRKFRLLFCLALACASFAIAADTPSTLPTPAPGEIPVKPKVPTKRPHSAGLSTRIHRRRPVVGPPRGGRAMPPAGSAATGGTSASPGGAPTTPYGSPY